MNGMSPMPIVFELLVLGGLLGFAGGLLGIGGGIVAVPLLRYAFAMDQMTAQGTALVMMVPNLMVACWQYARNERPACADMVGIALGGTAATWASAGLAQALDQSSLGMLFALFLAGLSLHSLTSANDLARKRFLNRKLIPIVGLIGGASMGLLGVGGGLIAIPLLSSRFGMGQRTAQALGLALVAPSAVIALWRYASAGHVAWQSGGCMAIAAVVAVSPGVELARRVGERRLRQLFAATIGLGALMMLTKG